MLAAQLARDEYNTWCLLDRHLRFSQSECAASPDASVAWMRDVLAWLEGMVQAPSTQAQRCAWDKTCQGLASGRATPARVDAMDPDACSRQQRDVHPDDRAAEGEFLRVLWSCVRAGEVSRAQACCRSSQQWWRAASLAPAAETERGAGRRVWKAACRDLACDAAAPDFERAVYAVLSADTAALEAFRSSGEGGIQGVLSSWYDKIYVWAKVWVDEHDDSAAEDSVSSPSAQVEEMKQSLDSFLHLCSVATEEDTLAAAVAGDAEPDVAAVAETWVNDAVHFYRGLQELLIFTVPSLDYSTAPSSLSLSRMWSDAPGGVFPPSLRWPLGSNFSSDTEIQQLGDDLSSQLTRTALHAGILLSRSRQTRGEDSGLGVTELEALNKDYVKLLAATVDYRDSESLAESLALVADYAKGLPVLAQGDTLVSVLKDKPSSAWKAVLTNPALQPKVVAEVQYRIVQHIVSSGAADGDKLDALLWACSNVVDDGHDGLLMRIQGLRQVNGYLRTRMLEEGMEGLSGEPPCVFLDVGRTLCGAEMSDFFEAMYESVSRLCLCACGHQHSLRVRVWDY